MQHHKISSGKAANERQVIIAFSRPVAPHEAKKLGRTEVARSDAAAFVYSLSVAGRTLPHPEIESRVESGHGARKDLEAGHVDHLGKVDGHPR